MKIACLRIALIASLAAPVACGDGDSTAGDGIAALPDSEMLTVAIDGSENGTALVNQPSEVEAAAQELAASINDAVASLQERIDTLRESAVTREVLIRDVLCTERSVNAANVGYRLRVCELDRLAERYRFALHGRPATATDDAAYVLLVAGEGAALPAFEGGRRARGLVAFDLDALADLRGEGPRGKVAIGFRASGRVRALNVAYKNFVPAAGGEQRSGRLAFFRAIGRGGRIVFATRDDVIAPGTPSGYVSGQDGLVELARVALAWRATGGARVMASACGGTVGAGNCVTVAQCYAFDGDVTFEEVVSGNIPAFREISCPNVDFAISAPPSEAEVAPGDDTTIEAGEDDGITAPSVEEPAESTAE